jgi:hypothetical protein
VSDAEDFVVRCEEGGQSYPQKREREREGCKEIWIYFEVCGKTVSPHCAVSFLLPLMKHGTFCYVYLTFFEGGEEC